MKKQAADKLLDLRALSEYSCMSRDALRDHIRTLGLPGYKVGGKIIVRKSEFDRWLQQFRIKSLDVDAIAKKILGK